jgi:hypothetical protein
LLEDSFPFRNPIALPRRPLDAVNRVITSAGKLPLILQYLPKNIHRLRVGQQRIANSHRSVELARTTQDIHEYRSGRQPRFAALYGHRFPKAARR